MNTALLKQRFTQVLEAAWNDGSPVAGGTREQRAEIAAAAIRRIKSFPRRGVQEDDNVGQVVDLAKGLIAVCESKPSVVGPLTRDYEHLAGLLLNAT